MSCFAAALADFCEPEQKKNPADFSAGCPIFRESSIANATSLLWGLLSRAWALERIPAYEGFALIRAADKSTMEPGSEQQMLAG
jgi:hypothetical protein